MKVPKNAENADLFKAVDGLEFREREKYDPVFNNSMAVKFDIRFPAQPPMPIQPTALKDGHNWTMKKKRVEDLTFIDWEWIRMIYLKHVQAEEQKRIKDREEQVAAIADQDARVYYEKQLSDQKFRILMTWMERFRAERKNRMLRLQEHLDFIDFIHERRKESKEIIRLENFLVRRKKGLESPVPPPPVIYARDVVKEELMARHELAQSREKLSTILMDELREAQIRTASILLKQQLDLQGVRHERLEERADNAYMVNKIKATKR